MSSVDDTDDSFLCESCMIELAMIRKPSGGFDFICPRCNNSFININLLVIHSNGTPSKSFPGRLYAPIFRSVVREMEMKPMNKDPIPPKNLSYNGKPEKDLGESSSKRKGNLSSFYDQHGNDRIPITTETDQNHRNLVHFPFGSNMRTYNVPETSESRVLDLFGMDELWEPPHPVTNYEIEDDLDDHASNLSHSFGAWLRHPRYATSDEEDEDDEEELITTVQNHSNVNKDFTEEEREDAWSRILQSRNLNEIDFGVGLVRNRGGSHRYETVPIRGFHETSSQHEEIYDFQFPFGNNNWHEDNNVKDYFGNGDGNGLMRCY